MCLTRNYDCPLTKLVRRVRVRLALGLPVQVGLLPALCGHRALGFPLCSALSEVVLRKR